MIVVVIFPNLLIFLINQATSHACYKRHLNSFENMAHTCVGQDLIELFIVNELASLKRQKLLKKE